MHFSLGDSEMGQCVSSKAWQEGSFHFGVSIIDCQSRPKT